MKFPDHHPNNPYPPNVNPPFVPNSAVSIAKQEPSVKQETPNSPPPTWVTEFTKIILEALNHRHNHGAEGHSHGCNFCGGLHFIKECLKVKEMICARLCKHNLEGRVVLPSGTYIPKEIQERLLSDALKNGIVVTPIRSLQQSS